MMGHNYGRKNHNHRRRFVDGSCEKRAEQVIQNHVFTGGNKQVTLILNSPTDNIGI
jgi:prophage maintenance system killer protein